MYIMKCYSTVSIKFHGYPKSTSTSSLLVSHKLHQVFNSLLEHLKSNFLADNLFLFYTVINFYAIKYEAQKNMYFEKY